MPAAALILIRGQAESTDVSPGNELPTRGTPEAAEWEPLYRERMVMRTKGSCTVEAADCSSGECPGSWE